MCLRIQTLQLEGIQLLKKIDISQSFKDGDKTMENSSTYEMNSKLSHKNETSEPEEETKVDLGAIQASEMRKQQVLIISNPSLEIKDSYDDKNLQPADIPSDTDEENCTYI